MVCFGGVELVSLESGFEEELFVPSIFAKPVPVLFGAPFPGLCPSTNLLGSTPGPSFSMKLLIVELGNFSHRA